MGLTLPGGGSGCVVGHAELGLDELADLTGLDE
jgi:hypothetical protein